MTTAKRNIGQEILDGIREIKRGEHARVVTAVQERQTVARKRLKKLRKTARAGDITSPSGEVWDAERPERRTRGPR